MEEKREKLNSFSFYQFCEGAKGSTVCTSGSHTELKISRDTPAMRKREKQGAGVKRKHWGGEKNKDEEEKKKKKKDILARKEKNSDGKEKGNRVKQGAGGM